MIHARLHTTEIGGYSKAGVNEATRHSTAVHGTREHTVVCLPAGFGRAWLPMRGRRILTRDSIAPHFHLRKASPRPIHRNKKRTRINFPRKLKKHTNDFIRINRDPQARRRKAKRTKK